ncbi:MAG: TraB/GumN family protein, partial [Dictyoglomus sp.]
MKKFLKSILVLSSFLLFIINITLSQTNGIFWQVKSNTTTVYILGSIHYGTNRLYPFMNEIEEAFKDSQVLVVEADITAPNLVNKIQEAISYKGLYPFNDSIKNHVSEETFKLLEEYFGKENLERLKFFKPWVFYFLIGPKDIDLDPNLGVDMYFTKKAKDLGKEIIEIEGIDYQIDLFVSFPEREQENLVKMSLLDLKKGDYKDRINSLIEAYIKGDDKKIWDLIFGEYLENPDFKFFYEKFYLERNKNMIEKIREYLKDDKIYFIVVG